MHPHAWTLQLVTPETQDAPDALALHLWDDETLWLGRALLREPYALRVPDAHLSPRHARVEARRGRLVVQDLRSDHGVWLAQTRVTVQPLQAGDVVSLGKTRWRVHAPTAELRDAWALTRADHAVRTAQAERLMAWGWDLRVPPVRPARALRPAAPDLPALTGPVIRWARMALEDSTRGPPLQATEDPGAPVETWRSAQNDEDEQPRVRVPGTGLALRVLLQWEVPEQQAWRSARVSVEPLGHGPAFHVWSTQDEPARALCISDAADGTPWPVGHVLRVGSNTLTLDTGRHIPVEQRAEHGVCVAVRLMLEDGSEVHSVTTVTVPQR